MRIIHVIGARPNYDPDRLLEAHVGPDALAAFTRALEEDLDRGPRVPEGWDGNAAVRAAHAIVERYAPASRAMPAVV